MKKFWPIILVCLIVLALAGLLFHKKHPAQSKSTQTQIPALQPPPAAKTAVVAPIDNADARVTKKPFGLHVTPQNSPVKPERFSGYHTGTDFETTPAEANIGIAFKAICSGKILQKRTASGYGGLLVQACSINNQPVTVVYGHVSLKSIAKNVGDNLVQGEQIGVLGHSPDETDGERKHLHLGIHLGTGVNVAGYTPNPLQLGQWLDFQKL